jgi:thioesterase domain-containing protein/acyl carrier protein
MSMPAIENSTLQTARSADDIRAWILRELSRSMNVEPSSFDTTAPLDTLGVDSLAAIGMTGALAGWLQRDLPTTLMWEYDSIDAIANGLADPHAPAKVSMWPGVFNLQPNGSRTPIFFFPGLRGYQVTFAPLADQLGPQQPCFVLSIPGFEVDERPFDRVEESAAIMLENLRRVQPKGPYQLAGYSFGGLLAYECAQRLTAMGETISLLAIYDTFTPAGQVFRPRWQRAFLHAYLLAKHPGRMKYLQDRWKRFATVRKVEAAADARAPKINADPREARAKVAVSANYKAAANYRPRPYAGSMVLFRATERPMHDIFYKTEADNGWGSLVGAGLRIVDVAGSHLSFLRAEYATIAAAKLMPFLAAAQ